MKQQIVAVVFDFDETLAPDTTSSFLESIGIDVPEFWKQINELVKDGWDPVPAYLQMMLEESKRRKAGDRITKDKLRAWGLKIKTYPGVNSLFTRLRKLAAGIDSQIKIEFYVVSSGIGEILRATKISSQFTDIWAGDFSYNASGEIKHLKNVVSFTDKTRFLFQIAKGIIGPRSRSEPFAVNEKVPSEKMHVPFEQMIAVGDGYTDIPCFSLLQKNHGIAIGVYDRASRERWGKAWGFLENQRVTHIVAADYRKNSGLDDALSMAVERVCRSIALKSITYRG